MAGFLLLGLICVMSIDYFEHVHYFLDRGSLWRYIEHVQLCLRRLSMYEPPTSRFRWTPVFSVLAIAAGGFMYRLCRLASR
jgi:hypothetical protein